MVSVDCWAVSFPAILTIHAWSMFDCFSLLVEISAPGLVPAKDLKNMVSEIWDALEIESDWFL